LNKQTQKLSTAAVASQHLSFKLNRYEEPDPVKKDAKQCDQEGSNDSIDDSIKSSNLTM